MIEAVVARPKPRRWLNAASAWYWLITGAIIVAALVNRS